MQKIAGELTITNWEELEKTLNEANSENWGTAFNFFEQRILTRYLNPINLILSMGINAGEGFAVVNLQCSLIETIESFYNGCIYNPKKRQFELMDGTHVFDYNGEIFKSFFDNREPFKSIGIDGIDFYKSVRCSLLHETQTKKGWVIKAESDKIYEKREGEKYIYRTNFQKAIEEVIQQYKSDLINSSEVEKLRTYFKAKFNNICNESKIK